MKNYTGFTEKTAENLAMDAGAIFVNFDIDEDTFESAVAEGKLLGATRGGNSFTATPEMRSIEVDGVHGKAKGLESIDSWEIKMTTNVLEVTKEGLAKALATADTDTETNEKYDIITARNQIRLDDYIDNVTYVGKLSGSSEPLIIQIYNVLNINGLTLTTEDKAEAVIEMEFDGHYDANTLDTPPFAIYYPKTMPTGA